MKEPTGIKKVYFSRKDYIKIVVYILLISSSCFGVTWQDIVENWLYKGANIADLNGGGCPECR